MRRSLERLPGVTVAEVDLRTGRALVSHRVGALDPEGARAAVLACVTVPRLRRLMQGISRHVKAGLARLRSAGRA
ncbi:MAG: heavy-metal-associated domain-containing protein [Deltaproteobacteria bacterium]|nr:heavy-metal-associated domain-containing protein [Deltaproteobacteria bacterium]